MRVPPPAAFALAKAESFRGMHPVVFGLIVAAGAVLLIIDGLRPPGPDRR